MQIPQKLRISNSVKLYSINSSCGYVVDSKRRQNTYVSATEVIWLRAPVTEQ